jgi:hypothetical protein
LAAKGQDITAERNAGKEPIDVEEGWKLVSGAALLVVASGKRIVELVPTESNREEILAVIIGRSGKLRAPALRVGDRFVIGYNEDICNRLT